ncbi:MAG: diaminopimelate decarboxylase [Gammaproteobacteria bacterium]
MTPYHYQDKILWVESCPIPKIIETVGTPCYVYSKAKILEQCRRYKTAFKNRPFQICYALKANSNLAILKILKKEGLGFDIVSMGELYRVLQIGADPARIVFSGVCKTEPEILKALEVGIGCFNVESEEELLRINRLAASQGKLATIALRINPDIASESHPYISTGLKENKFGIPYEEVIPLYQKAQQLENIQIKGIACHIGSQITQLPPFVEAIKKVNALITALKQHAILISQIDFGGGLGVRYTDEAPPSIGAYVETILSNTEDTFPIWIEPGRSIVAEAGLLVTRIEYLKKNKNKSFCIVDAGMNTLIRPALYAAQHALCPIEQRDGPLINYDVVGPICESSDLFAKHSPLAIEPKDLLGIQAVGAYGFSMCSQYNSHPRPPEVLVDGDQYHIIRTRETFNDLFSHERVLSD